MFGYGYYRKEEEADNERYLEGELERHRQAEERRSAEEERQRNARRQEVQEQFLWDERHASSWPDALRARLEAIGEEIRLAVADRLAAESSEHGWTGVAQAIREEDYNNWLWW